MIWRQLTIDTNGAYLQTYPFQKQQENVAVLAQKLDPLIAPPMEATPLTSRNLFSNYLLRSDSKKMVKIFVDVFSMFLLSSNVQTNKLKI